MRLPSSCKASHRPFTSGRSCPRAGGMTTFTRRSLLAGLAGLAAAPAFAQSYPNHPISLLVPWAPGGSTDILARIVAAKLHESMDQPVIIDNRTGAAGNIGTGVVARAAPDGYTILFNTMSVHTMNHALFATMPVPILP